MRVMLDETICQTSADSVAQAIAAATALTQKRGRMIVEVIVDGHHWTNENLDQLRTETGPVQEVRLISADPLELVSQTFRDASHALTNASQLQNAAAELLQSDQIPSAMEKLQEAISIWLSVQQALTMGLQLAHIDLNAAPLMADEAGDVDEPLTFQQLIDALNVQLRQMHVALHKQDLIALADTLLYDMPPVVQRWQDLLENLERRVLKTSAAREKN